MYMINWTDRTIPKQSVRKIFSSNCRPNDLFSWRFHFRICFWSRCKEETICVRIEILTEDGKYFSFIYLGKNRMISLKGWCIRQEKVRWSINHVERTSVCWSTGTRSLGWALGWWPQLTMHSQVWVDFFQELFIQPRLLSWSVVNKLFRLEP